MDRTLASAELSAAARAAGLTLAGPLGRGHGGARWSAVDDVGRRWVLDLVPAARLRAAQQRLERLVGLTHPALAVPVAPERAPGGGLLVRTPAVDGVDLAVLHAARPALTAAEVVTVLVVIAGALAALHRVGLVHGDVSPGNVLVGPAGPVLVDLVSGADRREVGTPGFADRDRARGATAAGDVRALTRVGDWLLGDSSAPAQAELHAALAGLRSRPSDELSADRLVAVVGSLGPGAPVALPDAAILARLALRRLAAGPPQTRTAPRPARRWRSGGRHRRSGPGRRTPAVVVVLAGVVLLAGGLLPGTTRAGNDPVAAAVVATRTRVEALVAGDPSALAEVTVPGSPAAAVDRAVLGRLVSAGARPSAEIVAVLAAARPGRPCQGRCAVVQVTAWTRTPSRSGGTSVDLVLGRSGQGWAVREVRAAGS